MPSHDQSNPRRPRTAGKGSGPQKRFAKNGEGRRNTPSNRAEKRPEKSADRAQTDDRKHNKAGDPQAPAGLAARQAALDIIMLIGRGRTLDEALDHCRSFDALRGADRGLARALATTILRRRGVLDHVIGAYIDRPLPKKSARVMDILRLSAAQSIFLKTPDHAAVSLSVSLAKEFGETAGYAALVNAVARKIATHGAAMAEKLPERTDTPGWMWRAWERHYGPKIARDIAFAHRAEAPLDLTPRDAAKRDELATAVHGDAVGPVSIRLREKAVIRSLPGFEEGAWWVQDTAASLPALLLGDINGKTVLDLCAAPGGKTMQLAASGANVTAVDQAGPRLLVVQENLARVGLKAETIKADVLDWAPPAPVDAILLDAPCSATGTIRRHPDILWTKTEDDVAALAKIQAEMIDRAITFLKPGGVLVYCVCSLQPEEGERQIKAALERNDGIIREAIDAEELPGFEGIINRDGDLRTLHSILSEKGGIDGFFAARLLKT